MRCRPRSSSTGKAESRGGTKAWQARMTLKIESRLSRSARRLALLAALSLPCCLAQTNVLSVTPPEKVVARRGAALAVKTSVVLKSGYHVNSNTPSESYLIPLRLALEPGVLETIEAGFPKPHMEKYEFSPHPISVFTGDFELVTKFKVAANASIGPGMAL